MNVREGTAPLGTVAIVGAGQVGTMLGMALRRRGTARSVGVHDRDRSVAAESVRRGAADAILAEDAVFDADTVVLAVPVPEIVEWIDRFGGRLRDGATLTDTGSAKVAVVEAMRRRVPQSVHAIGGHPLAGIERGGPAAADPRRLQGATFVLTPVREDPTALERGRALATAVGATPFVMDPEVHDRIVARTSHLPHVLAYALAMAVASDEEHRSETRRVVAGGFESATRLAVSPPDMVAGFLACNAREVRRAVGELQNHLAEIVRAMDAGPERLAVLLGDVRSGLESLRGTGVA